jgi:hypothetical protein
MKKMETYSGTPAFSQEQRDYYFRRRAELQKEFEMFEDCPELRRLPIPILRLPFVEWRKQDIRCSRANPVHLALLCAHASKKQELENIYELECAKESNNIDDELYETLLADVMDRKQRRLKALHGLMSD